ncbi:hypothetical protein SEVIR_5G379400v4 [Setaria viridis]|uniref:Uncharacterized protein n=2 Tax=Setaria TaxID=4554 RepID=A0A368REN5_SETIT|nr:uncharacterized protein LOC101783138 [Setaria italica]XP_022682323.1 uncharacterized protein LOC101783138 [Setaria italica]XP_022682324.1 uncharacterized protein LOC101783138 [Setaria italica]XP_034595618.1 uncharacterized protein LOC117857208 [Setaria viridis]XP_034595619.1 uncharacterized protein LOC117857208 [Setaria viridis]XP_034595621.1 uncharacterized protein LOC117857208 [Setaria viridis]RCV28040.1 hypothetical protein SETIT_5G374200v2 [Setaria italica]TKW17610.1 hypothetical prot
MDREGRRPVVGESAAAAEAMDDDVSSSPAAAEAMHDDGSLSPAAAEAMDDDGSSSPASYIRLVQHLIEKCICYSMNKEECMVTLEKHANIQPVITSTVWKELEKENREFFETYRKENREFFETYKKDRPGEESTQKNPSDEKPSAPKSSEPQTTTTTTRSSLPLPRAQTTTTTRTRS